MKRKLKKYKEKGDLPEIQPILIRNTALGSHYGEIERQVSSAVTEMPKKTRSELKRKVELMDNKENSHEGGVSEVPNLKEKIETLNPVVQPSLDLVEEEEG